MKKLLAIISKKEDLSLSKIDSYWVRGFFILPLAAFGIMHFVVPRFFEFMVPSFLGNSLFWVNFSGVALLSSSLCIFLKILPHIANFLLILFVITFILAVDIPGIIIYSGDQQMYFCISIMKDTSLLGGSLAYFFISRMR